MSNLSEENKAVLEAIKSFGPIRSSQLVVMLKLSTKTVYKHLAKLLDEQLVSKVGQTPKVFYVIRSETTLAEVTNSLQEIIDRTYIYVSASGQMVRGLSGFQTWCFKNNFDYQQQQLAYISKIKLVSKLKKHGLLSAKKQILSGKHKVYLDNTFLSDYYTLDYFGKTKLGQLVYLGKSSQNKDLIREVATIIKLSVTYLIEKYAIKSVCYIPPTIDRKVQFMNVLKQSLAIDLPEIVVMKVPSSTKVPQKTLRKLEDRITNAQMTMAVDPNKTTKGNILIIDDATGSGATLNETAKKIKIIFPNIKVYGYSVVGSYKGFDVISEV